MHVVCQNAEFLRIVEQLSGESNDCVSVSAPESGCGLDCTEACWPDQDDTPLDFPLAESVEFDNYWNTFDPFDSDTPAEDRGRVIATGLSVLLHDADTHLFCRTVNSKEHCKLIY